MGEQKKDMRLAALRRFATAITILNILGHTVLGFEQSWATPLVAVGTAYLAEILLEIVDSRVKGRRPRFLAGDGRGKTAPIDFLLSAHISGLAVSMLLYANDRLLPIAFAAVTAIGSKYVFRAGVNGHSRHFFNPSNLGITATLLCFPWVGIAQPYMFTENLSGIADYVLPAIIIVSGSFLNLKLTKRVPLILAWLGAFVLQAAVRHFVLGTFFLPSLNPMTGVAFLLFTFYMVTDPATTPSTVKGQIAFGAAVAASYGALMTLHVVFGLFFALSFVCVSRGVYMMLQSLAAQRAEARVKVPVPA
jgi:Na+-translocating ferredoxin:NAD+ oxidoreductase RnfD subunit